MLTGVALLLTRDFLSVGLDCERRVLVAGALTFFANLGPFSIFLADVVTSGSSWS